MSVDTVGFVEEGVVFFLSGGGGGHDVNVLEREVREYRRKARFVYCRYVLYVYGMYCGSSRREGKGTQRDLSTTKRKMKGGILPRCRMLWKCLVV